MKTTNQTIKITTAKGAELIATVVTTEGILVTTVVIDGKQYVADRRPIKAPPSYTAWYIWRVCRLDTRITISLDTDQYRAIIKTLDAMQADLDVQPKTRQEIIFEIDSCREEAHHQRIIAWDRGDEDRGMRDNEYDVRLTAAIQELRDFDAKQKTTNTGTKK